MIKQLRTIGKPSFMLYVSDHGETPHSETWRDPADDDLWEVPLIVWLSPEYKERFPEVAARLKRVLDKPIQTDRIFKLFLSLARVEGFVGHVRDDDVLSDSFDGHKVRPCGGRVR